MRSVILALAISLMLSPAMAVVGGPDPDDGEASITSAGGSSASSSVSVGPNGTEWSSKVAMRNRSLNFTEESIRDINYSEENYRVDFSGSLTAPTPCHVIGSETEKVNETHYAMNIETRLDETDRDRACAQVITSISYDAEFETEDNFSLIVNHNGENVDTLNYPEETGETPEKDSKGFFGRITDFFTGFFR